MSATEEATVHDALEHLRSLRDTIAALERTGPDNDLGMIAHTEIATRLEDLAYWLKQLEIAHERD